MATRRELLDTVRARYAGKSREQKGRILDEFVATTGYHRKHGATHEQRGRACALCSARKAKCGSGDSPRHAIHSLRFLERGSDLTLPPLPEAAPIQGRTSAPQHRVPN
jgi:hypothetical protein